MRTAAASRLLERAGQMEAILLVPLVALLAADGNRRVSAAILEQLSVASLVFGSVELFVGIVLLWKTVNRWAKWIPSFALLGCIKALASLSSGRKFSFPNEPYPRSEAAVVVLFSLLAGALTWRYVSRTPTRLEGVGLLALLVSTFPVLFFGDYPVVMATSVAVGLLAMALARFESSRRESVAAL
jgi:hypothetical protein